MQLTFTWPPISSQQLLSDPSLVLQCILHSLNLLRPYAFCAALNIPADAPLWADNLRRGTTWRPTTSLLSPAGPHPVVLPFPAPDDLPFAREHFLEELALFHWEVFHLTVAPVPSSSLPLHYVVQLNHTGPLLPPSALHLTSIPPTLTLDVPANQQWLTLTPTGYQQVRARLPTSHPPSI
jgi:hypothetical protein